MRNILTNNYRSTTFISTPLMSVSKQPDGVVIKFILIEKKKGSDWIPKYSTGHFQYFVRFMGMGVGCCTRSMAKLWVSSLGNTAGLAAVVPRNQLPSINIPWRPLQSSWRVAYPFPFPLTPLPRASVNLKPSPPSPLLLLDGLNNSSFVERDSLPYNNILPSSWAAQDTKKE